MSDGESPPEIRLELYVRSLLPRGACESQEAIVERLRALSDEDVVDAVDVTVWGRGVAASTAAETEIGRELLARVEQFSEWARERGLTLRPRFERRAVRSRLTGESYDAIYFPAMAVAAFRDDDLAFVAPCADGTTVYTVADALDAFEHGIDPDRLPAEGSTRTVRETAPDGG